MALPPSSRVSIGRFQTDAQRHRKRRLSVDESYVCLQQDFSGRFGRASGRQELDRAMKIRLAPGDTLGKWEWITGFHQDVKPPAFDFRSLCLW